MNPPAPKRLLISLPAIVAGLMIVFWPVVASAACCCKHDEATQELTVPACQHCCHVVPNQKSEPLQPCDCGIGCHSSFVAVLPSVSQVSDQILATPLPQEDRLQFPGGAPLSSKFAGIGPPRFLLAQACCAQICCWLK